MRTCVSPPQQRAAEPGESAVGGLWAPCPAVPGICWEGSCAELITPLFILSILSHFLQQHLLQENQLKEEMGFTIKRRAIASPSLPPVLDTNLSS